MPVGQQLAEHRGARRGAAGRPREGARGRAARARAACARCSGSTSCSRRDQRRRADPRPRCSTVLPRARRAAARDLRACRETSGPMTWTPFRVKPGTVGRPIPGVEVVLADDGEVLCRGGNIFRGYLNDPEKTAEALDDDGWLHTGDIGELDDDGYLRIVDRKKELIITAGGKNISPANLEAALKAFPLIGQACVIGDSRPFISALSCSTREVAPGVGEAARDRGRRRSPSSPSDPEVLGRGRAQRRRGERAVLAGRADQEGHAARRGVAARLRGAHADDEAQAPRHPREVRRRDRGDLRLKGGGCVADPRHEGRSSRTRLPGTGEAPAAVDREVGDLGDDRRQSVVLRRVDPGDAAGRELRLVLGGDDPADHDRRVDAHLARAAAPSRGRARGASPTGSRARPRRRPRRAPRPRSARASAGCPGR